MADWKMYSSTTESDYYYNDVIVSQLSKDLLRASIKEVYSSVYLNFINFLIKLDEEPLEYLNRKYTIVLREINCKEKMWRNVSITDYSKKGEVVFSSTPPEEWRPIPSPTIIEKLFKEYCR